MRFLRFHRGVGAEQLAAPRSSRCGCMLAARWGRSTYQTSDHNITKYKLKQCHDPHLGCSGSNIRGVIGDPGYNPRLVFEVLFQTASLHGMGPPVRWKEEKS